MKHTHIIDKILNSQYASTHSYVAKPKCIANNQLINW